MNYKLLIVLLLVGYSVRAQNSVSPQNDKNTYTQKTSYSTASTKTVVKLKHPYDWYFDQKVKEYEERMKAKAKEYKKLARLMKKPQYSDPSYFGHKRKPKKRPSGKRKFCKECEMTH